jgi:uncharacterized membrane protein
MSTLSRKALWAAAWSLCCAAAAASAQNLTAHKLCYCTVTDLSDDGRVATGQMKFLYQNFRWVDGQGLQLLGRGTGGRVGRHYGRPAVSGDGQVVAGTIMAETGQFATLGRWTPVGGWEQVSLPFEMDPEAQAAGSTLGLSRDGRVVTGLLFRDGLEVWPARWEVGSPGQSVGGQGAVFGANVDGRVLVGETTDPLAAEKQATVWVDGQPTLLGPGTLRAVNATGTVVVGQVVVPAFPKLLAPALWRWNGSTWDLRLLVASSPRATADLGMAMDVSDDGQTVVGYGRLRMGQPPVSSQHGFIWTEADGLVEAEHYFERLGYPVTRRMHITSVDTISADGRVMGVNGTENASRSAVAMVVRRTQP